jgi:hypothetical protein
MLIYWGCIIIRVKLKELIQIVNEILIGSIRVAGLNRDTKLRCLFEFHIETLEIAEVYIIAWNVSINLAFITLRAAETEIDSTEDNNWKAISWGILIYLLDNAYLYL